MWKFSLAILFVFMLGGCTTENGISGPTISDPGDGKNRIEEILEIEGYENIKLTGAPFWGCSEDDSIFTSSIFEAEKNGRYIEGVACCGLFFKGCTIRLR